MLSEVACVSQLATSTFTATRRDTVAVTMTVRIMVSVYSCFVASRLNAFWGHCVYRGRLLPRCVNFDLYFPNDRSILKPCLLNVH